MADIRDSIRERVNRREIYRYLGYGRNTPDDTVKGMTEDVLDDLTRVIEPKNIYKIYDCGVSGNKVILRGAGESVAFESANLSDNLRQCPKAVLLAATLGLGADKLMQKYEVVNMAKASMAQSCGAAAIEAYCNILQEEIRGEVSGKEGEKALYLRPRFSPGYGDLALECQMVIFKELECTKRIGLTLTDSLLMYPTKSVTAFIGFTDNPQGCHIGKCKNCSNLECEFRDE